MSNRRDLISTHGNQRPGSSTSHAMRRLDIEDDEIIKLPECDLEAAAERFKLTLIGRVFQLKSRSIDALINLLPKPRIWNVEGRVRGTNLGNGRFQFDFENEHDLQSVLNKRPCHFNQWSFALERWEPFTRDDFPNSIPFWISVTGVPVHFWNDGTFSEIAKALGKKLTLDSKRAKIQVSINVDNPLQFERRVGFPNGDIGRVTFVYDGLHRYCFNCKHISHDENSCPLLTEKEREHRRLQRLDQNINNEKNLQLEYPRGANENRTKRPRSPPNDRIVRSNLPLRSRMEEEREEKRQRHAYHGPKDHPNSFYGASKKSSDRHYPRDSGRDADRRTDVWNRIEQPQEPRDSGSMPRLYSSLNHNARVRNGSRDHRSRTSSYQREWRPRTHLASHHNGERRSSDIRASGESGLSGSLLDSQRTISENLNGLEAGEIPRQEDAEQMERRRLKGKGIATATPTSKEKDRQARNSFITLAPLSIREPDERRQSTVARYAAQEPRKSPSRGEANKDLNDMEIDKVDEAALEAMVLTEDDLENLEKSVKEFEGLEMDDEMIDKDDLLDETPDMDAEQIDALTQLSPAHAEDQEEPQDGSNKATDRRRSNDTTSRKDKTTARNLDTEILVAAQDPKPKGVLKKKVPKSPDAKGSKASKKLSATRGRNSPKGKLGTKAGKALAQSSRAIPRHEVFPSASSKNSLSLSGSVVSQKPPSKRI